MHPVRSRGPVSVARYLLGAALCGLAACTPGGGDRSTPPEPLADDTLEVRASAPGGAYNVPISVWLTTREGATISFALGEDADPLLEGERAEGDPIEIRTSEVLHAIARDDTSGELSPRLELRYEILDTPTLRRDGTFTTLHEGPVKQEITRTAFFDDTVGGGVIAFSTLESYGHPDGDRFLLHEHDIRSGETRSTTLEGAIEARSRAWDGSLERWVLGTSLDTRVLLHDLESRRTETILAPRGGAAWIHKLATRDGIAWTALSTPATPIAGFSGLLRIDLRSGAHVSFPWSEPMAQNWAGAQSIDPTGRVWCYRAFPFRLFWREVDGTQRERRLPGFEDWTIESWDTFGDAFYLVLTRPDRSVLKLRVDPVTLERLDDLEATDARDRFHRSLSIDLYAQGRGRLRALGFDPATNEFCLLDRVGETARMLFSRSLGRFDTAGIQGGPMEEATRFTHPRFGFIEVLGVDADERLVLWFRGHKEYALLGADTAEITPIPIEAPNLTAAEVTSLVDGGDGWLYGGGLITFTNLFRMHARTLEVETFRQTVPGLAGEINWLFRGEGGQLHGVVYPDSIIFRFDPRRAWAPGTGPGANPVNLGPMGHHNQTVARRGVEDADGVVWWQSRSDYTTTFANAVARADFDARTLTVKTDLDDGFPRVVELARLDDAALVLLGARDGAASLFRLDTRTFEIDGRVVLGAEELLERGGVLTRVPAAPDEDSPEGKITLLAIERDLYRVRPDLSLARLHRAANTIERVVDAGEGRVILVSRTTLELVSRSEGRWEIWWDGDETRERRVVRSFAYAPFLFREGRLFFADEARIRAFDPPPR